MKYPYTFTFLTICLLSAAALLGGCGRTTPAPEPRPAPLVREAAPVPGTFLLVVGEDVLKASKIVIPASSACSSSTYPAVVGGMLSEAIKREVGRVVQAVVPVNGRDLAQVKISGVDGIIHVGLERFVPRLAFEGGIVNVTGTALTEIILTVTVTTPDGETVFTAPARGHVSSSSEEKGLCSEGNLLLEDNLREAADQTARQLANLLAEPAEVQALGTPVVTEKVYAPIVPAEPVVPVEQKRCFKGYSDDFPDTPAINEREALEAAMCLAIKDKDPNFECLNSVSVEATFRQLYGDAVDSRVTSSSRRKTAVEVCVPEERGEPAQGAEDNAE